MPSCVKHDASYLTHNDSCSPQSKYFVNDKTQTKEKQLADGNKAAGFEREKPEPMRILHFHPAGNGPVQDM